MTHSAYKTTRRGALLGGGATALGLGATSRHAFAQTQKLVAGVQGLPDSLVMGFSSFAALNLSLQTQDALVHRDDFGALIPGLAVAWTPLDAKTWRFDLRRSVKFHDGKPFTAADVKFTLDYAVAPDSTYGTKSRISQISGVEIKDDHTVIITTQAPFPTLANGLSDVPMEPKHYVESVGRQGMTARPMGTGPFRFKRWVPGDRYELTANAEYWGGRPPVEELVIRQIPEGSTRVAALLTSEIQIAEELPIDLIETVQKSRNAEVADVESSVGLLLTFDARKPPFNNAKVRLALNHAIDRKTILERLLLGRGTLLQGQPLTSNTFGFNPDVKSIPYDPARAKTLLAEAGYPNGFETSITTRSGKYLADVEICNVCAAMLSDVGVKTSVNVVEQGVFSKMTTAGDLGPIHMVGWYSLGDADFATVWFTEASRRTFWKNAEYERLFLEGRTSVDEKARLRAYHRMMEIMRAEAPSIFLFGLPSVYGKARALRNWSPPSDKILRMAKALVA